jgi:hypothetical protein
LAGTAFRLRDAEQATHFLIAGIEGKLDSQIRAQPERNGRQRLAQRQRGGRSSFSIIETSTSNGAGW